MWIGLPILWSTMYVFYIWTKNVNDVCVYAHIVYVYAYVYAYIYVWLCFLLLSQNCFSDAIVVELHLHPLVRQYQIVVPVGNEVFFLADPWSWGLDAFSMNMHHSVVVRWVSTDRSLWFFEKIDHAVHLGHSFRKFNLFMVCVCQTQSLYNLTQLCFFAGHPTQQIFMPFNVQCLNVVYRCV